MPSSNNVEMMFVQQFPNHGFTDSRENLFLASTFSDLGATVMDAQDEAGSWLYGTHDPQRSYLARSKRKQKSRASGIF
jgi:hypothetical protein